MEQGFPKSTLEIYLAEVFLDGRNGKVTVLFNIFGDLDAHFLLLVPSFF